MTFRWSRIDGEKKTIRARIEIDCRRRPGGSSEPCASCRELLDDAFCRLDRRPFGGRKPTCVHRPIHRYRPAMRDRVRELRRDAGPHLLPRRPLPAILHPIDGRRGPLREQA
jgi:hypothetical protein